MSQIPPPQQERPLRPPVSPSDLIKPVTRRGRLVAAGQRGGLDLLTENGRFELLGPFGVDAREGDDVEIVGVPAPMSRGRVSSQTLLVREMRLLE
jgi:hypothetical protein